MDILRILLLFIIIGSGILFLVRKLSISQYLAPFITITGITSILYVFALFDFLKPGLIIIAVALLVLGVFSFINWPSKIPAERTKISPPLVVWAVSFLIIVVTTAGTLFYKWDEFTYWGVIYRYLMATDQLPDVASNILVQNYPPFTALFQYFTGTIVKNSEANAYLAQMLLSFSAIIAIIPNKNWKDWKKYAATLGLCILFVFPMDLRFQSLYVDLTLGLLFAAGLVSAVFNDNMSKERVATVTLASIGLILTKPLGLIFSMVCISVYYFDVLFKYYPLNTVKDFWKSIFKPLITPKIILLAGLTLFAVLSWNIHSRQFDVTNVNLSFTSPPVNSADIYPGDPDYYLSKLEEQATIVGKNTYLLNQPAEINISVEEILRTFTVNIPYRTRLILQSFIEKLSLNQFATLKITCLQVLLFIMFITFLIHILIPHNQRRGSTLSRNTIILLLGFVVYNLAHLFAYIYYFPPTAGLDSPSLQRYLSSYLLGWWALIVCYIYQLESVEIPWIKIQASKIIAYALFFILVLVTPLSAYIHSPNSPDPQRFEVNRILKAINPVITREDKVYDVWQVNSYFGFNHYILKYSLTPIPANNYGWRLSLIGSYKDETNNGTTTELTPDEWLNLLNDQNYTRVLISASDYIFWQEYGTLFDTYQEENIPQLFSVTPTGLVNIPIDIKY